MAKPRLFSVDAIKAAFCAVAKAVITELAPKLKRRRTRREETEGAFRMTAPLAQRVPRPIERATDFLWDVLDWLNPTTNANQPHPHEQLDQCARAAQHYPDFNL